ncbi:patatin-like phospholipase family protein [Deinococcus sp. UYEF24]
MTSADFPINEPSEETLSGSGRRAGTGLCLSGGGFRAALFHLGAAQRLEEFGLLSDLRTVSSVSGGSLFAAFLARALSWPRPHNLTREEWAVQVARPFQAFCAHDLRTAPVLKGLLPWNWNGPAAIERVAELIDSRLTLGDVRTLPPQPNFVLCATDMAFGVNWVFERGRMGDYLAGYAQYEQAFPLSLAAAASACFPVVFSPLHLKLSASQLKGGRARRRPEFAQLVQGLRLADGGNYDNLALEPVWKSHAVVLVSDGGSGFDFAADRGLIARIPRHLSILDAQSRSLRKRWLLAESSRGQEISVYWSVGQHTGAYAARLPQDAACLREGYSAAVAERIGNIRTDLDAFSEGEAAALENHGYALADAAVQSFVPGAVARAPEFRLPRPEWRDEVRVQEALRDSHQTRLIGRSK